MQGCAESLEIFSEIKRMKTLMFAVISVFTFSTMNNIIAQDWANLKKYELANSKLSPPKTDEDRVVFMGNSITEAWINVRPDFFKNNTYINRGISGQTTPQMLIRFKQDVVDLRPKVVVILAGINDIAGNTGPSTIKMITDNIFSMAEIAKANGIKVILCSVLPAADFPWQPDINPGPKVNELNKHLQAYSFTHNLVYVDYYSAMVDNRNGLRKELGEDSVHPNVAGYLIMEPIIAQGITKSLKK
ncbi:MAG: lysophospholipase L1-like esterase [Roseivirga sp.]